MTDPTSVPGHDSAREKHLELVQGVVARMGANAFAAKGWSVAAASAVAAVAATTRDPILVVVAALPTFAFWWLDAYYLALERHYRTLYEQVRRGGHAPEGTRAGVPERSSRNVGADAATAPTPHVERYALTPSGLADRATPTRGELASAARSVAVAPLHGGVLAGVALVAVLLSILRPPTAPTRIVTDRPIDVRLTRAVDAAAPARVSGTPRPGDSSPPATPRPRATAGTARVGGESGRARGAGQGPQ